VRLWPSPVASPLSRRVSHSITLLLITPQHSALYNESHSDVTIEVPLPRDERDVQGFHAAADLMTRLDARVHAVLKHS
jgi:hypothetical protein